MSDFASGLIVLCCTFGGAMFGMWLGRVLPEHHLSDQSRDTVKVGMGLTATIAALVLGLVTASAKSDFDAADAAIRSGAAKISTLDRVLVRYGPESAPIRASLRAYVVSRIDRMWPEEGDRTTTFDAAAVTMELERTADLIEALAPTTDTRRDLRSEAVQLVDDLLLTRWQILQSGGRNVPRPFLVIVVCWLTIIFASFGLLAARNATTMSVLFLAALSVAAAVFLILELADPFDGMIKVSSAPVRFALAHLEK